MDPGTAIFFSSSACEQRQLHTASLETNEPGLQYRFVWHRESCLSSDLDALSSLTQLCMFQQVDLPPDQLNVAALQKRANADFAYVLRCAIAELPSTLQIICTNSPPKGDGSEGF